MAVTTTKPPAPARNAVAPTPRALQKRKLTIAQATDQWTETTLAIEGLQALRKEAADVLLAHAERTGKRTFKDTIAVVRSGGSLVLDQGKVTEYLIMRGQVLKDFQKRSKLGWTLKLLK